MNFNLKANTLFILFLASALNLNAQTDLSVQEIVDKTYEVYKYLGDDKIATAHMDIKDKNGKIVMERDLLLLRKNEKGTLKQKWYAYFNKPADIRKMVFMAWKNPEKDDNRWLFLPAMDLVKRLSGSDKRSSFAGSQFVYEDVTGRNPALDQHELVTADGDFFEIKSTPIKTSGLEFSYYYTYVNKENFIPMKRVFYDENGESHRVFKTEAFETIQDYHTITSFSMTNVQTGASTFTTYTDIYYNVGIEDKLFSEAYLRRTPRKWMQYGKK